VERLVERAMTYAVEEYDDDLAVARLAWLARDDQRALDQACDVCLSCRRLQVRYERRADILLAFLQLACTLICLKSLMRPTGMTTLQHP
jgi:hypothetical protein